MNTYPCVKCGDVEKPFLLTGESFGVVQCAKCHTCYPAIIEDTRWEPVRETSLPHRGIHDYRRVIKFTDKLTDEQLKAVRAWLEKDACPGWTGVNAQLMFGTNSTPAQYKFTTTYDSSD